MTASVGSLLDDAHARAWNLCSYLAGNGSGGSAADAAALLAAWPRLAASALRVLDAVRIDPVWLDDTLSVRDLLGELVEGQGGRSVPDSVASLSSTQASSRPVLAIATRLGAIADLLAGQPDARTEDDRAAAVGLQANVLAVVHAVAAATLAALEDRNGLQSDRWLMRGVLARTERFAVTPTSRRTGRYEDVAANTTGDRSLDSAIAGWVRSTVAVLQSRHLATQTALQVAAGDALMLTGSAATVCLAATHLGIVDADRGGPALDALSAAHESWRTPSCWPETVRLGGIRDQDQTEASRLLRRTVADTLRQDGVWLPIEELARRHDVAVLLATMRRGLHGLGNVALAHYQAIDTQVRGPGRLWIAASAVTQAAYRGFDTVEAACRRGWVVMPPHEPVGQDLLDAAKRALTATTAAVAALDGTARTDADASRGPGVLQWERGRIVAYEPDPYPRLFETINSPELSGSRAARRTPIPLGRPPALGPRR